MLKIKRVHIDYLDGVSGVTKSPQFGWEIESDTKNFIQEKYRLQIAADEAFEALDMDTGWVDSDASAHVRAEALSLVSSRKYYVRVQIATAGETSAWSETNYFVTALMDTHEWKAPFVSAENKESDKEVSKGTYVRGSFTPAKKVRTAYAYTTALGLYNFFINGKKVGEDEMTPGWTSYNRHLLYQTYDVTDYVTDGENMAGAMLGCGWYSGVMGLTRARNNYGEKTAFAMQLLLIYEDGETETITTNDTWQGADAPIVFSEIYNGETYDASLEIENWAIAGSTDPRFHDTVSVPYDTSLLEAQTGSRVRMMDQMEAVRIFATPKGESVIDFGQNMTGRIHVNAEGKAGDVIELRCFEVLDADGNVYLDNLRTARTAMKYIFAADGEITWHPRFTYMGFRYAVILSWPGTPKKENFTAWTLHSEMERTGDIVTSNPDLNQLHHNYLWGLKGNFLDVPTDCPQRDERLGWTGDAQIFCRTANYLTNAYTFFKKWLVDVAADQTPEGGVPHVVPNIEEGRTDGNWLLSQGPHSAAAWADVAVIAPWTLHLMYGDNEILARQYESMKQWIDFMRAHSEDYIWNYKLQFGDWVALDAEEGSYFGATPNDLTCTAYFAYSTGLFVKSARALGKTEDEKVYQALYDHIVAKYQKTFFGPDGHLIAQTQTAQIVSLYFHLTPKAYIPNVVTDLKALLAKENGHLVTGFVGTPYFCHALSENGCVEEAYDLLLKEDYPSWLYQVKKGATTIWEHWDGLKPDGSMWSADMNSFNHYAYGAIGEWMYRVMLGIEAKEDEPGFKEILIQPRISSRLDFAGGHYHSIYGDIAVKWELFGDTASLIVSIPANTKAVIRIPEARAMRNTDGLTFAKKDGCFTAETGSGRYIISFMV